MVRKGSILFFTGVLLVFFFFNMSANVLAQVPEREYVVGVSDQLEIQVWNKGKKISELSARVTVRSDGKITMPWLGDIQAAGLKISILKEKLEGKELLGKYLNEPRVTIDLDRASENIRVTFSGIFSQTIYLKRGVTLGWVYQNLDQLIPNFRQLRPNLQAITVKGAGGEEFSFDPNLRLEWGDEIIIPPEDIPTPTPAPPITPTATPVIIERAELTKQEYEEFLEKFPSVKAILESSIVISEDKVTIDIDKNLRAQLEEEVLLELEQYIGKVVQEIPKLIEATLMGIRVNLAIENILEAFLAFPDPNSDDEILIKRFKEGDVIQQGASEEDDIILDEIQDDMNQIILKQAETIQILPLSQPFTEITLSGILNIREEKEALLSNFTPRATKKSLQKRFKEGDEIEKEILLAKISESWVLLQKEKAFQLVLLRDPRKRASQQPTPTPLPAQDIQIPGPDAPDTLPGSDTPDTLLKNPTLSEALKKRLPPQMQAIDTFSRIFFATPLF